MISKSLINGYTKILKSPSCVNELMLGSVIRWRRTYSTTHSTHEAANCSLGKFLDMHLWSGIMLIIILRIKTRATANNGIKKKGELAVVKIMMITMNSRSTKVDFIPHSKSMSQTPKVSSNIYLMEQKTESWESNSVTYLFLKPRLIWLRNVISF